MVKARSSDQNDSFFSAAAREWHSDSSDYAPHYIVSECSHFTSLNQLRIDGPIIHQ